MLPLPGQRSTKGAPYHTARECSTPNLEKRRKKRSKRRCFVEMFILLWILPSSEVHHMVSIKSVWMKDWLIKQNNSLASNLDQIPIECRGRSVLECCVSKGRQGLLSSCRTSPVLAEMPNLGKYMALQKVCHLCSASFQVNPWVFLMWALRLLILALLTLHTGQQKGFSPVCILVTINLNIVLHWILPDVHDELLLRYELLSTLLTLVAPVVRALVSLLTQVQSTPEPVFLAAGTAAPALGARVHRRVVGQGVLQLRVHRDAGGMRAPCGGWRNHIWGVRRWRC